ncbi:hypothetical protein BYT27DRAFT_7250665 [Phlegmacium glaucopus]|nr:hypothetical protein BYT27DRAFT_7250665 [Phlegmacium glaucopus]
MKIDFATKILIFFFHSHNVVYFGQGVHPKIVASNLGKKGVVNDFTVNPKIVAASNLGKKHVDNFIDHTNDTLLAPDCDDHDETSDGIVNIPEDSVVDTESSMSDAGLGLGGFLDELESDGDQEQDADYIMSHKSESDIDDSDEFDSHRTEIDHIKNKKAAKVCDIAHQY